ncbi:leukotoxin LktA family filamentous adhesin [Bosea sp. MMO-172]|uniref:leukotoxin LktA family filamentous adhesin n=1 Tax=Bosea sp. MMO-172 TaxID=3127885 RepID=UPI0030188EAC
MAKRRSSRPAKAFVPDMTGIRQNDAFAARPRSVLAFRRQHCLVGQAMALALWNAPAFAQNIITPDGRTQTSVSVNGTTTTITTQTVSGGAGYNSFSRFEQAAGTTVNMHLPQNTGVLVNIVRDGPVVINGILNSYRNGQIGGHIYFSDSAGFTVGPSGVINTGRLTVNTPTREFLDQVIGPNGVVNEALAARLRANDVPISPDGTIAIDGRINARGGVTLNGHSVSVAGQITANAASVDLGERRRRHGAAFAQSVNTNGLRQGATMVTRRGGGIEIVAAGTASISGSLTAKATARRPAGSIAIRSGKGTTVAATARITATGVQAAPTPSAAINRPSVNTGDGGTVSIVSDAGIAIARGALIDVSGAAGTAAKGGSAIVFAGTNLDVADGALFRAAAGSIGDGGFLELSARDTVTLGAIDVDLSARNGKAGLLYIDPANIVIGTGGSANMITNGTNVVLEATNSITIANDGIIDTRNFDRSANGGVLSAGNPSLGNSGNITLAAPTITVRGKLLADVSAGSIYAAGDVTLNATQSQTLIAGPASATAGIKVSGTITGRDITMTADARAKASYADASAGPLAALAAQTVGGMMFGLNGGYVGSTVSAKVEIEDGARITAARDVKILANGVQEATLPAITLSGNFPWGAAVSIAEITGEVKADVASGARITVGRNLDVNAFNDVNLMATALTVTTGSSVVAATVAYGALDITTSAQVHSGAIITGAYASRINVSAGNSNTLSTSATAMASAGSVGGIAFAYSDYKASADARFGADLGSSGAKIGSLTVQATSDTDKNATSAATTVGNNALFNAGPTGSTVSDLLTQIFGTLKTGSSSVPAKVGSAIAVANSSLSASAAIAADPAAAVPSIYTAGDVVVAARQRDFGVRVIADSSTNSNSKDPTAANPSAQVSVSFGIGVGDFRHDATASIGAGVSIEARHIGVAALNEMPIANTWQNWGGLGETFSHLNGNMGVVNNILTTYANASSQADQLGLAGAINYFRAENNSSAYIASGARLTQSGASGDWSSQLDYSYTQNWDQAVHVTAETVTHSIDVGGNFAFLGGTTGGGSAVGGSLLSIGRNSETVAAIAAGVNIEATGVAVTATTSDKMFVIATTSGESAGTIGLNGIVSLSGLNNRTLASISNLATITAPTVAVKADQLVSVFGLSGALVAGGSNAIGAAVAVLDAATITRAYIGDNSDDLSDDRLAGTAVQGLITANTVDVAAVTEGRITVASAAGAAAGVGGGGLENFLPPGTPDFVKDAIAASNRKTSSSVSLTGSGASSVALTALGTSAWIDNAVLAAKGSDGLKTTVTALNSTIAEVGAGSAAINLAGNNSPLSGALAGAVAIGHFDNSTDARIAGSQLTGIYDTTVQAVSGGRATVVGLGVAGASSNGGAIAISAALGLVTNRVAASIADSSLAATAGHSASQAVRVNAYQTTDIGIGGGAAYGGGQVGVGMALTYADIRDPDGKEAVSAKILRSRLTGIDSLQVRATNASRIVSSAATGGLGGNGLGGAFVINRVTPTTSAAITGVSGALATVSVLGGTVTVLADGSRVAEYDDLIAGRQTVSSTNASQVDFSGRAANNGTANPEGAAVVAIAGVVQAGRNNAGVALLDNTVAQSHLASIDFATVTASGRIRVAALDGATLTGVAIGLGAATGQFAGTASVVLQSIENAARAHIGGAGTVINGGIIEVTSTGSSAIRGSAGSLGLGFGAAALGLSVVENNIANEIKAEIDEARLVSSNDLVLRAGSTATIDTLAIGIAMAPNVGLAGSVANNSIATDVGATITGADIVAGNNIGVFAANADRITVSAGALGVTAGAPSVAGGLSIVNNTIGGATVAAIGADSIVDARAGGSGLLSYNAGQLASSFDLSTANGPSAAQPSLAMAARSIHGLGVVATSQQSVLANAVTGGVAIFPISAAIAVVPIRNVLAGTTSATIDDSLINTRLTGTDSTAVAIEAASHSYAATFITVGSIGGAAAAGADANTIMRRVTHAGLTNSTLGTTTPGFTGAGVTALDIAASASQAAASNVLGFAVGIGGAAASGVVNSFAATTTATLDQGLVTAGRAAVNAESRNGFYARAISGAAGGVGMGSSFVVGTSRNTTLATIGGGAGQTVLNLNGALAVAARSANAFTTLSAGGAAGGFAGVAGMVSFVDVENETRAGLYGAVATLRPASGASISVTADETSTIAATTAAGANGGFGAGAAANIANLDSRVLADITGSKLSAPGGVSASATSERIVDANTMTYGVGSSAGIGAAVAVISVGTGTPSGAGAELNANGNGTLARVDQLTAGNGSLVLSAGGLAAYRSYRGAAGAAMSDAAARDAAQADYNQLLANGSVANGALTLSSSGVTALRSAAATALGIASPTDTQVRDWAAQRYAALSGGAVSYLMSDAGVSAYRATVTAATPDASADQIRSAANDAYGRLLANGTVSNGVLTLSGAGLAAYRADATASLGHAASDAEVRAYAAAQYSFFNANRSRIIAPAAQSASALLDSDGSRTAATVSGGSLTSGSIAVSALSRTTTSNIASGVGAGGAAGGGAATAYTDIGDNVSASLTPTTAMTGALSVTASSTDGTGSAARVEATAGAGALAAAAGAAVAKGTLSNQVTATLGGALTTTGATTVNAVNSQTGRSDAFGATVAGGLALGVSLAKSAAESRVAANYLAGSNFSGTGLSINATSTGAAHAAAVAGVGGLLAAGSGAEADADDSTNVSATIGAGARARVGTGTITVAATASPDAKASARGIAVAGGLAVGAAVAKANAAPTVRAAIESNASLPADQFTAGTLSVLATGSVFGTPAGDASQLPGSTGSFGRGGTSAAASAIAGSGAYYVSAVGTDAQARNTASVMAFVGDHVRLPTGVVTITASNTTTQAATSTGITTGGSAAIGSVKALADSDTTTLASLGNGATMAASGVGSFSLTATGSDTQIAHAKAGSGGLYAGSGAEGVTGNTATVTASLGENAVINTGFVTVAASHDDRYASLIDSLQASAVGASAALGRHDADVDVLTSLGAGSSITAAGPNTAGCYLSSCLQAVSITSRNAFTQLDLGDSVQAAAGGGINGAGATSTTEIIGTSKVILGDNVGIASGRSPTAAPGPMLIQAWTELSADDTASLTTGGLLQGAGVTAHYSARVDNEVTLGRNNALTSFGAINIGTYTTAMVQANAYVNTYGLAGVGVADADVTVITNNNVKIGANSSLIGLADVNVVAGREGSGLRLNSLTGKATALGYVRGIIAVPVAAASTNLQNHAKVQVDSGATISSAQNVGLGAYDGLLNADADGTGHGYQLYFIPVTSGTSSPGFSSSSTLVMNGTATAGIYNTQRIEIGCGPTASVQCGPNDAPTIRFISGAPITAGYDPAFNVVAYVNANYDPTVAGTLLSGVSSSPVKAVRLSQLYAAGGNVRVSGSRVEGSGTLTANGGPSITVINRSNAYLILDGGAYIPETTGGQIIGSSGSLTRRSNPDATPIITIDNSYTGALDASGKGPGLLIAGDITNLAGVVSLNNTQGSFGFSGQRIDALQFNTTVPNGAVVVSSNGPNGMYNAGATPQSEYAGAIYYPGGGPGDALNVDEAVFAAANALAYGQGATNLNYFLYGKQDEGTRRNFSMQFYGNCIGYIGNAGYACTGGYDMGNDIRFMVIPDRQVYRESNPAAAGGGTKIYGAQVAIKATTININASIEAGRITNWSGTVDAAMATRLRNDRQYYLDRGYVQVGLKEALGGAWANEGAAPLYYDLTTDKLVLWDVNASSGGGSVLLDGQIISTNTLGKIKVNGGFGNVSLNNQSGLDLITNRINTGTAAGVNASVSTITIIDRLITSGLNTKIYAYTPGSGIAIYKTMNGAQPTSGPVEFIAGDTASYDPVAGTRYEWTQQALLQKEGLTPQTTQVRDLVSYWRYDSGSSGNPWVYVDAQSPSTNPGADWMYWWSRNAQAPSGGVSGRITNKPGLTGVGLTQEITGGQLDFINNEAHYSGCNLQAINHCDRDFVAQPGAGQAIWNYQMVTRAFVQVTASVKADNRFGISFAGNAAGAVNVTSNSSILQNGTIVNPSGTTTITASGGSFTQTNNASILSNSLNLNARDSIGTQATAIQTTLTSGAQLSAVTGRGGINLDITGSARIAALRADGTSGAYGDIRVRATGSLDSVVSGSANVVGRNITLSSETGSVGSIANPLKMRAVATLLPNGSYVDGVVNVSALGDIGIAQVSGDLRVGEIASEAGNVRIDVNAGRLVSATGQTAAQALSADQLSEVSRSLKLTSADGAEVAAQASVASFEKQVTQSYGLYIALMRNGSVGTRTVNGVSQKVFTLNDNALALYQAFADAALGHAASAQEVKDYAAARYAAYSGVFEMAYGSGWASKARFNPATADSNFSFSAAAPDAAQGLATRIAGDAVWTDRQLISAINKSALQPASGVVGNGTALVVGRDVTLNIAGSIGSLAPDMQVALDAIRNGTVTDAQLAALSVATTAGSVKIMGQRQDGSLVEVTDLGNVPAGVTLIRVDVKQTAPLFVNATGTFSASAQGDAYVQATTNVQSSATPRSAGGTLIIGRVTATGAINLQAPQGIVVGTQADGTTPRNPVQIQTGGDLVLAAGGGGIGSAAVPLTYQIGGRLVSASAAAGDAYLIANAGNAEIGRIFASGTASLTARSGGIQGYLPGIAISAGSVQLNATGNIGSASAALGLQVGASGSVSGQAGGQAWLSGPAVSGQSPSALRLGAVSAVNGLTVTADGEIDVLGALRSSAGAIALTGAGIVMNGGADIQAAGRASLASSGDIRLGHVASALAAPAGAASIVITAAGSILSNGDAGTLLDAGVAGGAIALQAGVSLGSATDALTVAAPRLSVRSLAGDIHLAASGATHVTSLLADAGAATLTAGGNLRIDTATIAGRADISTTAGTLDIAGLTAGANSTLSASGAVTLGDAGTTAGDLTVISTGANLSLAGLDVAGKLTLTAATSIAATGAIVAGGTADVTAQNGTLTLTSLRAGDATALEATGLISLTTATTTAGAFSAVSSAAGIAAGVIEAAGNLTLTAATSIAATGAIVAGGTADITAQNGTLTLTSLRAGGTTALEATGAISLTSVTTTAGGFSAVSSAAGITAGTIDAAGAATLTAAGPVSVTTSLTAGGAAEVTTTAGTLDIAGLTAGANSALSASGAVALGDAGTTAGDLTVISTGANLSLAGLDVVGTLTLTAATSIAATGAIVAGGTADITAQNGTLTLTSLRAGGATALEASGLISLTSATTTAGALSAVSSAAGITAGTIDAAGAATLTAAGPVSVATSLTAGGAAEVSATAGTIGIADVRAGGALGLRASGAVLLGTADAGGDLSIRSMAGTISATSLTSGGSAAVEGAGLVSIATLLADGDIRLSSSQAGIAVSTVTSGGSAVLMAAGDIDGGTIAARDTLAFLAGSSGQGSIRIVDGAARRLVAGAPDMVRLGRFSAGESIVITGTQIAADIVQLPGGELPLALDVTGFRSRSADRVDLNIAANSILASRIAATDGRLTTTASKVGIAEAFIPGAFVVTTPSMTVLTNNRTLAPDYAYDAQLFVIGRPFYLDLNGSKLMTNAYILRVDSDVVDVPFSSGGSLTRDVARLGALLTDTAGEVAGSGLSFGTGGNWRGFWAGSGSWRGLPAGQPLDFVASAKPGQPPVNLDETEDRP